ncbi:DUF4145 domain-containing protein, partial [Vibrio parahaemolyticus]
LFRLGVFMIEFCPHCCNRAKQEKICEQRYESVAWGVHDGEVDDCEGTYHVYKCTTCSEILVYHNLFDFKRTLVYPNIHLDSSVPDSVSKIYDEAVRVKYISPNSFAVQIRRALEALTNDRGVPKGNLASKLKVLSERGEIPGNLAEATDILRLVGNLGAHADKDDVHPLHAMAIDEFFRAIVDYVYVAPARIDRFNELLSDNK